MSRSTRRRSRRRRAQGLRPPTAAQRDGETFSVPPPTTFDQRGSCKCRAPSYEVRRRKRSPVGLSPSCERVAEERADTQVVHLQRPGRSPTLELENDVAALIEA